MLPSETQVEPSMPDLMASSPSAHSLKRLSALEPLLPPAPARPSSLELVPPLRHGVLDPAAITNLVWWRQECPQGR
jgi:hypothetical protein|eukprot:SAG25_NODE_165_length_13094_cov_31.386149_14_plen_76_part_00